jgi:hypothetical protein
MLFIDLAEKDEIGVACGAYVGQINASWFWVGCLYEGNRMENRSVDKMIILKIS